MDFSTLGVLRTLAGLSEPSLLSLDNTSVSCKQSLFSQGYPVFLSYFNQGSCHTETDCLGLA
jgi:hypothetical protein